MNEFQCDFNPPDSIATLVNKKPGDEAGLVADHSVAQQVHFSIVRFT